MARAASTHQRREPASWPTMRRSSGSRPSTPNIMPASTPASPWPWARQVT